MATATLTLGSQNRWLADGSTTIWNFNFSGGYLAADTVHAYSFLTTETVRIDHALEFISKFQVRITPAVAAGRTLVIYRDSSNGGLPRADFTDGGGITEGNLDALAKQAIFVSTEMEDFLGISTEGSVSAVLAAVSAGTGATSAAATAAAASASASATSAAASVAAKVAAEAAQAGAELAASNATAILPLLAGTGSGQGASQIGVQDAQNWFTGANGEEVLAELGNPDGVFSNYYSALRKVPPALHAAIKNYTSTDDHSAYIQAAVDYFGSASSVAQGTLLIPRGKWNLKTAGIVLPFEVGVTGSGGRATRIHVTGDWDAFSWSAAIPSFSRQVSITDLWIIGPGYGIVGSTPVTMATAYSDSAAGTNIAAIAAAHPGVVAYTASSGININHPWGIDGLTLKRLWIEEFPRYAIRTNQPTSGTTANCFQFSDWNSLYFRYCNVGMLLGYGFTGESSFSNITSQLMLTSCCDFTINASSTGPQGINIVNLAGGWSPYGVRMLAGTAGIIKFDMLHMETCTTAGLYFNSASISKVVLTQPWLAKCVKGFLGDAGGPVVIYDGTWQGAGNVTDNFIKLNATSNFVIQLFGQHSVVAPATGSAPTDQISATDIGSVRGAFLRKSATAGTISAAAVQATFLQTRGIASETSAVVASNLSGEKAIANGASTSTVTFARAEADASFRVIAIVSNGAASGSTWQPAISVGSKTTAGFTVYFSTPAPAASWLVEWVLMR